MATVRSLLAGAALVAVVVIGSAPAPVLAATRRTAPSTGHALVAPGSAPKTLTEIPDPTAKVVPSDAFFGACYPLPKTGCDTAALADFDRGRALEGLAPMTLPTGFDAMSAAVQVFALANIDRVDRGLLPVAALSNRINTLAQTGADNDADPDFPNPFDGDRGGSNWAGAGTSTLLAQFLWAYDDGVGSGNEDCTQAGDSGCWGHRHNILESKYDAPLLMGAAATSSDPDDGSIAEEFISHDQTDSAISPLWTSLQSQFPVGLSTTSVDVTTGTAQIVPVTAWASGMTMHVTANVSSGAGAWSVSPASCQLAAGAKCTLNVHWDPLAGSATSGALSVTGPNGTRTVSLSAPSQSASLAVGAAALTVVGGASTQITGELSDVKTAAPLAGHAVTIESRPAGSSSWVAGVAIETTSPGLVTVKVRPLVNTSYRLVAVAAAGYPTAISNVLRVKVRPLLTVSVPHRRVAPKSAAKLTVTSAPGQADQRVALQRRLHGSWVTVVRRRLGATGRHAFVVHVTHAGIRRYRVVEPVTTQHTAATSRTLAINVR